MDKNRKTKDTDILGGAVRRWAGLGSWEIVHEDGTRERGPVIIRSSRV
jgi:hypothetical protein